MLTPPPAPPTTEAQLWQRAQALAGYSLRQLADAWQLAIPQDLMHHKGWVGQLLERGLGANAGSRPLPDFQDIGIELKTIPVDGQGVPIESTYISIVPLQRNSGLTWETSDVWGKLRRVLWFPIITERNIPLPERQLGSPLLWSPNATEAALLQQDWEELMDMVVLGELEKITARMGNYLQIRPKAADGRALAWGVAEDGRKILTLPRGFYLRRCFTKQIFAQHFFV